MFNGELDFAMCFADNRNMKVIIFRIAVSLLTFILGFSAFAAKVLFDEYTLFHRNISHTEEIIRNRAVIGIQPEAIEGELPNVVYEDCARYNKNLPTVERKHGRESSE